jgi:hypothetical protein
MPQTAGPHALQAAFREEGALRAAIRPAMMTILYR